MGEIAEMMLEGAMCQWCGEFLDGGDGYPIVCAGCQSAHSVDAFGNPTSKKALLPDCGKNHKRKKCSDCNKRFRTDHALNQHRRDKHESPRV